MAKKTTEDKIVPCPACGTETPKSRLRVFYEHPLANKDEEKLMDAARKGLTVR